MHVHINIYKQYALQSYTYVHGFMYTFKTMRETVVEPPPQDHHWVMFDGPVDALWIESLGSQSVWMLFIEFRRPKVMQ